MNAAIISASVPNGARHDTQTVDYSPIWLSVESSGMHRSMFRRQWQTSFVSTHRSVKYTVPQCSMGKTSVVKVGLTEHASSKFSAEVRLRAIHHKSKFFASDPKSERQPEDFDIGGDIEGTELSDEEDARDIGSTPYVTYPNLVGRIVITEARLMYGSQLLSTYRPLFAELDSYKDGSNLYNHEMLGRCHGLERLISASQKDRVLLVDLDFPFLRHLHNTLYHDLLAKDLTIQLDIADLEDMYICSDNSVPYVKDADGYRALSSNDIEVHMYSEVINIRPEEKKYILDSARKQGGLRYLIPDVSYIIYDIADQKVSETGGGGMMSTSASLAGGDVSGSVSIQNGSTVREELGGHGMGAGPHMSPPSPTNTLSVASVSLFQKNKKKKGTLYYYDVDCSAPARDATWVVQRNTEVDFNNFYNFSGVHNEDPIVSYEWKNNNREVILQRRHAKHARCLDPWHWNQKKTPDKHVYSTTWDYDPHSPDPTAFVRLHNAKLGLEFQPNLPPSKLHLFIRTWCVMELSPKEDRNNSTIRMIVS